MIIAKGDITYNVNTKESLGRVFLYSEEGNITINGTEITVNGLLYAPDGQVKINAYNTNLNGRIVAKDFLYQGSLFNIVASASDMEYIYSIYLKSTSSPQQKKQR